MYKICSTYEKYYACVTTGVSLGEIVSYLATRFETTPDFDGSRWL